MYLYRNHTRLMAIGASHEAKSILEVFESKAVSYPWRQEDVRQH
jgi:hypothetical protein